MLSRTGALFFEVWWSRLLERRLLPFKNEALSSSDTSGGTPCTVGWLLVLALLAALNTC